MEGWPARRVLSAAEADAEARCSLWAGRARGAGLETPTPCPGQHLVPRKQEELVQQVRKRLEEALMADMLAHVEELARDGEAPLDKACVDEEEEDEDDEEEEPEPEQELERV